MVLREFAPLHLPPRHPRLQADSLIIVLTHVQWINLPLTFASALIVIFLLPLKHVTGSYKTKIKQIDYYGSIITLGGCIALLIPLSW